MTARNPLRGHLPHRAAFTLIELLMVVAIIAILAAIGVPNFLEAQIRSKISRTRCDMAVVEAAIRAYHADHNAYPPNNPNLRDMLSSCTAVGTVNSCNVAAPAGAPAEWVTPDPARDRVSPGDLTSSYPVPPATALDRQLSEMGFNSPPDFAGTGNMRLAPLKSPSVDNSGWDLTVLTTPVAYFGAPLPEDVFCSDSDRTRAARLPFIYLNLRDLGTVDGATQESPGISTHWALVSAGPDRNANIENPVKGPWIAYDPTNGTVSAGDIMLFGGKPPEATPWGLMTPGATPPLPGSPEDTPVTCTRTQAPGIPMMPGMMLTPGFAPPPVAI